MLTTIVITHNRLKLTKQCIQSYWDTTPKDGHKLLVVDNASTDGTQNWLKDNVEHYILNPENYYLGKAWNIGFASLDNVGWAGKIDNDAYFYSGWFENLINVEKTIHPQAIIISQRPARTKEYGTQTNGVKYQKYPNDVGGFYYMYGPFLKKHNIQMPVDTKMNSSNNAIILGQIRAHGGQVVRLEAPGCVIKENYNDPDHLAYYEKTFGERNSIAELRKRQARELL